MLDRYGEAWITEVLNEVHGRLRGPKGLDEAVAQMQRATLAGEKEEW
jgi:hypothetical protein